MWICVKNDGMEDFIMLTTERLQDFHRRQMGVWPMAAANFEALSQVATRDIRVGDVMFHLQHNPARIRSTAAKIDKASLDLRPCFLCDINRPVEQMELPADDYKVLVNPFPIFPLHFTIPARSHCPQHICGGGMARFSDMLEIASRLPGLALFYNGPACGASAPDHFHFQAVERDRLPIFSWTEQRPVAIPFKIFTALFNPAELKEAARWFAGICGMLGGLEENRGQQEPRMNILCAVAGPGYGDSNAEGEKLLRVIIIPRRAHRPSFYGSGEREVLLSPASVDLSGVLVVPSDEDFRRKITPVILNEMIAETCYSPLMEIR